MTAKKRLRWELVLLTALACVLAGSCGGDGEPSGEAGEEGSSTDTTSGTEDALGVLPPTDLDDPGVDEGLEGVDPGEVEDAAGFEDEGAVEEAAPEQLPAIRIPAGTRISTSPDEHISTAEYRVDDPVIVTVTHDVLGRDGEFLLPQGVRLLGRVRASMSSGGPGEAPILEIDFETLSADRYERPMEGVVVNRPVILDPVAARRRRSASSRVAARTVVPGLIMAGTIIVVELRAPLDVPPPDPYSRNPSAIPPRRGSDHPASDPSGMTMISCTSPDIPPVK